LATDGAVDGDKDDTKNLNQSAEINKVFNI